MSITAYLSEAGRRIDPDHPRPWEAFREHFVRTSGGGAWAELCFELVARRVDLLQAGQSTWADFGPDLTYLECTTFSGDRVRVPLEGEVRQTVVELRAADASERPFAGQDRLAVKLASLVLQLTGVWPVDVGTITEGDLGDPLDHPGTTRWCFEPWELRSVDADHQAAPCHRFPPSWDMSDHGSFVRSAHALQGQLRQGELNSLCQNCDAKARVPADAFRAELAARRLDEVFGRSARSYAEHATHGPPADRPPAHLRRRVSGSDDEVVFDLTGIQAASRLMQYVVQYDRSAQPTLLDWGCGCGRAAQTILANLPNVRYTGTDIDREAIAWCAANLHGGSFVHQGIDPPLRSRIDTSPP